MEIKPVVKIIRYFAGLLLVGWLVTGCSTTRLPVDLMHPPVIELSKPIETVAVLNRVNVEYSSTKQYVNGQVIAQFNGITDIMVKEAMAEMVRDLNSGVFVEAFDTNLKYISPSPTMRNPPAPPKMVARACNDLQVDAIVIVESYDAEIDTDSEVHYSTPVDRTYGTVQIPYFSGAQNVYMQMRFRTYVCKGANGNVENETILATQVTSNTSGNSMYEVNIRLADANNVLVQAARNLGKDFAGQITPSWSLGYRMIYQSGSSQIKEAFKLAKIGNWPGATDIWYLVATSNNEKLAKRASFNLIVASEISGDLELAEEWAQRCIKDYGMREAKKYLDIIEQRKKEIEKIHQMFPRLVE